MEQINKAEIIEELTSILSPGSIFEDEMLSKHTSFKIGGPAAVFVLVRDLEELQDLLSFLNESKTKFFLLGNGSNVLAPDEGYDGVVVKLSGEFAEISVDENVNTGKVSVKVGAGANLSQLSTLALRKGFTGLEFAHGIPGSVGGGVYMNAGAYGGEMKDVVEEVTAVTPTGKVVKYSAGELDLSYRHSRFTDGDEIIAFVNLRLKVYPRIPIRIKMDQLKKSRILKQPLDMPSAGSTFKRPLNNFAGKLIEEADLKGYSIGGARVSEKHAGFIVNTGNATAKDVKELIEYVIDTVYAKSGIKLEPEIRFME